MAQNLRYNISVLDSVQQPGQDLQILPFSSIITDGFYQFSPAIFPTAWDSINLTSEDINIQLLSGGCQLDLDTNCTAACYELTTLFASTQTLWNCLTLALMAILVQNNSIGIEPVPLQAADETLHFGDLALFNGTNVLELFDICAWSSCPSSNDDCVTIMEGLTVGMTMSNDTDSYLSILFAELSQYCGAASSGTNPDVAGPGVILSYIIQHSLLIILLPFYKLKHSSRSNVRMFKLGKSKKATRNSRSDPDNFSSLTFRESRPMTALDSIVVEFQETQAIFVATIQIAALTFFVPASAAFLGSIESFGDAIINTQLVREITSDSIYSVIFAQVMLQRANRHSWYTFSFALMVFALSTRCETGVNPPSYTTLWQHFKDSSSEIFCGSNPVPATYCNINADNSADALFGQDFLESFNSVKYASKYWAMTFLIVDQMTTFLRARSFIKQSQPMEWWRSKRLFAKAVRMVWWLQSLILQGTLLACVTLFLARMGLLFWSNSFNIDNDWTFGQFIAAMVWAPLFAKFLYYNLFGVKEGTEYRIDKGYEVKKRRKSRRNPAIPLAASSGDIRTETPRSEDAITNIK